MAEVVIEEAGAGEGEGVEAYAAEGDEHGERLEGGDAIGVAGGEGLEGEGVVEGDGGEVERVADFAEGVEARRSSSRAS